MANGFPFHLPHSKGIPPQKPPQRESPLSVLTSQTDGDTLLLLAFLWLASKEDCDQKLLLALCYIML